MNKGVIALLAVVLAILVFITGFAAGKNHVLRDSEIYLEDDHICIEIDDNLYIHY